MTDILCGEDPEPSGYVMCMFRTPLGARTAIG